MTTLYDDSVAMMCVSPFQGALGCEMVLRRRNLASLWGFSVYFGVKLKTIFGSTTLESITTLAPPPWYRFWRICPTDPDLESMRPKGVFQTALKKITEEIFRYVFF